MEGGHHTASAIYKRSLDGHPNCSDSRLSGGEKAVLRNSHLVGVPIMSHLEKRWISRFTLIFVCLTWLPYLFALAITPPRMRYMWLLGNPDDQNVHIMWARQAADGAITFKDLYTTERHPGSLFHFPMLVLGLLHAVTKIPLHLLYQIMRTAAVALLCVGAYWLAAHHFDFAPSKHSFIVFLCFSSGFGWLAWLLRDLAGLNVPRFADVSKELVMPEAITFLAALVAPLTALGNAFQVWLMASLASFLTSGNWRSVLLASLLSLALGNAHSYAALTVVIVLIVWYPMHLLWMKLLQVGQLEDASEDKACKHVPFSRRVSVCLLAAVVCVCLCSIIGMLPQVIAFKADIAFKQKALTQTLTPPPLILLGTYGLLAPLSLIGLILGVRNRWRMLPMPLAWLIGTLIAIHLPLSFQRKLIEGLHIPLCMLAAYAAVEAQLKSQQRISTKAVCCAVAVLTILMFPSNGAYIGLNIYWLLNNNMLAERLLQPPYYLTQSQISLISWVRENSMRDDAILCSSMLGNYIPPLSGRAVFIGHWAETLNFTKKLRILTECYRWTGEPSQLAMWSTLIRTHNVRFVLVTDFERAISGGRVSLPPFCKLSFRVGGDEAYRVDLKAFAELTPEP